jgi:hypothetical protein
MNERIKELRKQAAHYFWSLEDDVPADEYDKKFAELIVKECADFVTERATIETLLGKLLKEHFGVEE